MFPQSTLPNQPRPPLPTRWRCFHLLPSRTRNRRLRLDSFLVACERKQMAEGWTAFALAAAAEIETKRRRAVDWQHRWRVMDPARLYPGPLSYIKRSVNTTFLLANGICRHERDVIVGPSLCLRWIRCQVPTPRLSCECLALARGTRESRARGIMKLPLRKQIRSNSQGEERWNQIALITYQVLRRIHKGIAVMKDEPGPPLLISFLASC